MAGAAEHLKRITLELGGNDAGIVLDDVDPKTMAPRIFAGAFANSGQVCVAIKRLRPYFSSGLPRHEYQAERHRNAYSRQSGTERTIAS